MIIDYHLSICIYTYTWTKALLAYVALECEGRGAGRGTTRSQEGRHADHLINVQPAVRNPVPWVLQAQDDV